MHSGAKAQFFDAGNNGSSVQLAFVVADLGLVSEQIDGNFLDALHAAYNLFDAARAGATAHTCDI